MILAIQGTRKFDDYTIFMRAMGTALYELKDGDRELVVYSAGPANINSFCQEFFGVAHPGLKGRGIKTKIVKVPPKYIRENIHDVDYLAYFSKPKEPVSDLVDLAEAKDIEIGIYRY